MLEAAQAALTKRKDWAGRRWFTNGQGQTFSVIDGPVSFQMGSPAAESERTEGNDQPPHQIAVPRKYALADKEVSNQQFDLFLKVAKIAIERYHVAPGFLATFSPEPDGPCLARDWYAAAHYCNWLSEREGLPKEEWCYVPNDAGLYAEGMSIPADALLRVGYRLPTEAEWEYACRAGAVTGRYYGHSPRLVGSYACYRDNSQGHAQSCGGRLPNDLGLFDMLGNSEEWCLNESAAPDPISGGRTCDRMFTSSIISFKHPRPHRGGMYTAGPADIRSAMRNANVATARGSSVGFRVARTCR